MMRSEILLLARIGAVATLGFFVGAGLSLGADRVEIDFDTLRRVGGINSFDRSKFLILHSSLTEPDWNGEEDKLSYLLNDLDTYLGRDNGGMTWAYNQANEDPNRKGFVEPAYMVAQGADTRTNTYGQLTARHQYEDRSDLVVGALIHPFWPGSMTNPCCGKTPWGPTSAEGTADYMGRWLNEFYRDENQGPTQGAERPKYVEVMNEPIYELVTVGTEKPIDVFEYHNTIAAGIRALNPDVQIGGYTVAFPYFDEDNFKRWDREYKLFMDTAGASMDFLSLHFYDFNEHWKAGSGYVGPWNYKGGRIEATLDLVEQYSMASFGEVKPMLISEYGGRDHRLEAGAWSPKRDWVLMKAFSPLMMAFMDRSDRIIKAIPFVLMKAEWSETIYNWRLMRKKKEAPGVTGEEYVFTEIVKFFELWSDVKGKRVEVRSGDPDVLVDAYVSGNKGYLILCNLEYQAKTVALEGLEQATNVRTKHLFLQGEAPVLVEQTLGSAPNSFTLESEATAIIEYTFSAPIVQSKTIDEANYYADKYTLPIAADALNDFKFSGVAKSAFGEAVLRVGLARDHGLSLRPLVKVNGVALKTPEDLRGDEQLARNNFYGLLEIPVPYHLIKDGQNEVSIAFEDNGGHLASLVLRARSFSDDLRPVDSAYSFRSTRKEGSGLRIEVADGEPGMVFDLVSSDRLDLPAGAWETAEAGIQFGDDGRAAVSRTLTGSSEFYRVRNCPECLPAPGEPTALAVSPKSLYLVPEQSRQLTRSVEPITALDKSVAWQSSDPSVAVVDGSGLVTGRGVGLATITATATLGALSDTSSVKVINGVAAPGVEFDNNATYLNPEHTVGTPLAVVCRYEAGAGQTVSSNQGGIRYLLRELKSDWSVVKDVAATDASAIGFRFGASAASIPTAGLTPTSELPSGNFYYLFLQFETSGGQAYNRGISPIKLVAP